MRHIIKRSTKGSILSRLANIQEGQERLIFEVSLICQSCRQTTEQCKIVGKCVVARRSNSGDGDGRQTQQ